MGHAYDPTKSRNYKQHVKSVASELNIEPLSGPIRVAIEIYRPLQKSGS
ncbi:MAG: RusA family crossover junction endodeoxyribonuclease, partial [Lacticaseibacillus paracasei]|nr:RusA family crossover junction endodeoxyribonuclease [Lacticaseibacillus paracasei]